jgi:hypothetical protein
VIDSLTWAFLDVSILSVLFAFMIPFQHQGLRGGGALLALFHTHQSLYIQHATRADRVFPTLHEYVFRDTMIAR